MTKFQIIGVLVLCVPACALANPRSEAYRNVSDAALDQRIRAMDATAILEAGRRRRQQAMTYLDKLASQEDIPEETKKEALRGGADRDARVMQYLKTQHEMARVAAKKALARMGSTKYLNEFVSDLHSSDGWKRIDAIEALGYVGDKRAAKYLAPILYEVGGPPRLSKDESSPSFAYTAERALAEIFPEVEEQFKREDPKSRFFFNQRWKTWWKRNSEKYKEGFR